MANWFITGVGGGLGKAIAAAALNRGDAVAGTVRNLASLGEFENLAPGCALGFLLDVADEASLRAAIDEAEIRLGGLDILVNNAGYGLVGAVEEASPAEIRAQFEINVFAPVYSIQAVLPYFRKRRAGRIINISSVSGIAGWAGTGIYCGSKFALEGIAQTLAQEVREFGVKVTNVEPGGMRTDYAGRSLTRTQKTIGDYEGAGHDAARILTEHAGKELGDPAKVARAILAIAVIEDPPLQLLLGSDAMLYATQRLSEFQAEIGRWSKLTLSTDYD